MDADPDEILRTIFGFAAFRGVQERAVADVVAGRDLLLVMPTGAGKSLCYQVPALVRPGCAIVVSPLLALMAEQVQALKALGVRAEALNSQTTDPGRVVRALREGRLNLLFVAPERAATESFARTIAGVAVALLAIDEAHCVSEWGHDFRPDYRRLRALADLLPGVPRLALTATADAATRADICAELGIAPDRTIVAGFDRPNIRYEAREKRRPADQLLAFVGRHRHQAGIVYCQTRSETERIAQTLVAAGVRAYPYHAGLDPDIRDRHQRLFRTADDAVMVATIAFGMGIDKPDVRFVAHMGVPKSIEAYYQETGRAGRDGLPAVAHMLWGPEDFARQRQRIDAGGADEARKAHEHAQVSRMLAFAETAGCRRVPLLMHFGEPEPPPCGNCDNCLDPPPLRDVSEAARKLLSAIYRTGQRFGMAHVVRVLRGAGDARLRALGHHHLSVFGIGADMAEAQWLRLGARLEAEGVLVRDPEYRGLRLTEKARPILRGETAVKTKAGDEPARGTGRSGGGAGSARAQVARAKAGQRGGRRWRFGQE
jgi:ATP-dependent DNA helicase RecQ